jgi:phosphoribosylanthranilate isomerase
MSLWIKICANTTLEDAQLAAEAGADAVGFVFAPSPRRVTVEQAAAMVPHLPGITEKIGVFVDAGFEEIASAVERCPLTGVQLHFDAPPALAAGLRRRFGSGLRILRVVHFEAEAMAWGVTVDPDPSIDAILVDSGTAAGGTGKAFDWVAAGKILFHDKILREYHRLIAAGGLSPENVSEAIVTLRPWGVDVASGVEAAHGRKDPARVRAFIANARSAGSPRQ